MALKRPRKNAKTIQHEFVYRICDRCKKQSTKYKTRDDVIEYICGDCFIKEIMKEDLKEKVIEVKKDKFPRGWHFKKEFVAPDGRIFNFGKLLITEGETT